MFSKGTLFSTQISTYNLQMSNVCAVVGRETLNLEINSGFPSNFSIDTNIGKRIRLLEQKLLSAKAFLSSSSSNGNQVNASVR